MLPPRHRYRCDSHVCSSLIPIDTFLGRICDLADFTYSLSWADTAASTVGRYFGSRTPKLPRRAPILGLPLAPRKSLAGFLAASLTGACIAIGFWGWLAPLRHNTADVSWVWEEGVKVVSSAPSLMGSLGVGLGLPITGLGSWMGGAGGWLGLGVIGIVAGLVSGVAEALGELYCLILVGVG